MLSSDTPEKFKKSQKGWGLMNSKEGDKFALQIVRKGSKEIALNFIKI